MKTNITRLIAFTLLAGLIASCNSGNKVVSSVGKRKYTKGFYFNLGPHTKPELPVIAANKVSKGNNQPVIIIGKKKELPVNNKASNLTTSVNIATQAKSKNSLLRIRHAITSKMQQVFSIDNSNKVNRYTPSPIQDGVPGHQDMGNSGNLSHNGDAIAGFVLGILGLFTFGLLSIPGLIFSIMGLKSERDHTLAVIGLVLSIIGLLYLLLIIIIIDAIIQNGI